MKIAIVDDARDCQTLTNYILRFGDESGEKFLIETFNNGMDFISDYKSAYDIVFMDVKMPYMDGMTAAEKLREVDDCVVLIFITSLAQYAVRGYSVDALDFLVKPVPYSVFAVKMRKAAAYAEKHNLKYAIIRTSSGVRRIDTRNIRFIEVIGHMLTYHCVGEDVSGTGTLTSVENELVGRNFFRCSKSYFVNADYISAINSESVCLDKDELFVSRRRRKEFFKALADYFGGRL